MAAKKKSKKASGKKSAGKSGARISLHKLMNALDDTAGRLRGHRATRPADKRKKDKILRYLEKVQLKLEVLCEPTGKEATGNYIPFKPPGGDE